MMVVEVFLTAAAVAVEARQLVLVGRLTLAPSVDHRLADASLDTTISSAMFSTTCFVPAAPLWYGQRCASVVSVCLDSRLAP